MSRPSWEDYYINLALAASLRSTCIRRKYGSIIVKDNRIIGTGYNGSARGDVNCIDARRCTREELNIPAGERYEECLAVHAENNAIINSNPGDLVCATIYVAGTNYKDGSYASAKPCKMCARAIKNARIANVVYLDGDNIMQYYSLDSRCIEIIKKFTCR